MLKANYIQHGDLVHRSMHFVHVFRGGICRSLRGTGAHASATASSERPGAFQHVQKACAVRALLCPLHKKIDAAVVLLPAMAPEQAESRCSFCEHAQQAREEPALFRSTPWLLADGREASGWVLSILGASWMHDANSWYSLDGCC